LVTSCTDERILHEYCTQFCAETYPSWAASVPTILDSGFTAKPKPKSPPQSDLALPPETDLDLDVLAWWKARDHALPGDPASGRPSGLPHLAKMARQFLGRPASSAGVERFFSMAGKLHSDLKKAQGDDTLEHSLFAAGAANAE
jgi:hypothetical protein